MRVVVVFLVFVALTSASCGRSRDSVEALGSESSDVQAQNRGPDLEQTIKRDAALGSEHRIASDLLATEIDYGSGSVVADISVTGSEITLIESSPRRMAVISRALGRTPLALQPLSSPSSVAEAFGRRYIVDEEGIKIFEKSLFVGKIPLFTSVQDLAPLDRERVLINPRTSSAKQPMALVVNNKGQRLASWSPSASPDQQDKSGGLWNAAHVAVCSERIAIAPIHRSVVYLMDSDLRQRGEAQLPFPKRQELEKLADRSDLTHPTRNSWWLPYFSAGVACSENSFFVLLDLPRLSVAEFRFDGSYVATHTGTLHEYKRFIYMTTDRDRPRDLFVLAIGDDKLVHLIRLAFSNGSAEPSVERR